MVLAVCSRSSPSVVVGVVVVVVVVVVGVGGVVVVVVVAGLAGLPLTIWQGREHGGIGNPHFSAPAKMC